MADLDDKGAATEDAEADELHRSFREALERKAGRAAKGEQHLVGRAVPAGNNDTRKRQFRRKSGG